MATATTSGSCWFGVVAVAAVLVFPSGARATFAGRDGALLVADSQGGPASFHSTPPVARPADCCPFSQLYSRGVDGSPSKDLGKGDTGIFSPGGAKLAIYYSGDPCYNYM